MTHVPFGRDTMHGVSTYQHQKIIHTENMSINNPGGWIRNQYHRFNHSEAI